MDNLSYNDETATFGDRLTHARTALDMSEAELAKRLGVETSTIMKWENNQSEPRANRLYMLSGLLNISVLWLITGEGDAPSEQTEQKTISPELIKATIAKLRSDMNKMKRTIDALEAAL